MRIEWDKATWYSKITAIIVFTGFIPITTFMIGREYQQTKIVWMQAQEAAEHVEFEATSIDTSRHTQDTQNINCTTQKRPVCADNESAQCNNGGMWICAKK